MSKSKKKHATSKIPITVLLRPRLDALWNDSAFPQKSDAEIESDLTEIASGVKPDFLLLTFLTALRASPIPAQTRLNAILPSWLCARNLLPTLEQIAAANSESEWRDAAVAWLSANGITLQPLAPASTNLFYRAYDLDDKSQALVSVFWYDSEKKNRLVGMNFLIDYNPPWDGAIKDITVFPKREPKEILSRYVDSWAEHGQALTPISPAAAKTKILKALVRNRASRIRLSRDFIANRAAFTRFALALPDAPDTPKFTDNDWKILTAPSESADDIMRYEQTVGRRVRMEDGKEILIMGNLDDLDEGA